MIFRTFRWLFGGFRSHCSVALFIGLYVCCLIQGGQCWRCSCCFPFLWEMMFHWCLDAIFNRVVVSIAHICIVTSVHTPPIYPLNCSSTTVSIYKDWSLPLTSSISRSPTASSHTLPVSSSSTILAISPSTPYASDSR